MLRKRVALALAAVTLGGLSLYSPAEANHSWGSYHWARTANPLVLQLGDNVSGVWDSYLTAASSDWTTSAVLDTSIVPGQASAKRCNPTAGRIEVCSNTYGKNGWLGLASIWASGQHITQATTKVNDSYFNMAKYNQPAWRFMVMCQEVGHDFGLAHQDENFGNTNLGSCMDYTNDPSGTAGTNGRLANTHPNAHDYEQLATIYGHLDATNTSSTTASSSGSDIGDSPSSWGREVSRSADGRVSVFERDLGSGDRVLTHVTWADDPQAEGRGHAPE